jgi:hypothetical protein
MTNSEIVAYMSQSKNIEQWNERRATVHAACIKISENAYRMAVAATDCYGLVVDVLGKAPRTEVKKVITKA